MSEFKLIIVSEREQSIFKKRYDKRERTRPVQKYDETRGKVFFYIGSTLEPLKDKKGWYNYGFRNFIKYCCQYLDKTV